MLALALFSMRGRGSIPRAARGQPFPELLVAEGAHFVSRGYLRGAKEERRR